MKDCPNQKGLPCERANRCVLKRVEACHNFTMVHGKHSSCSNCSRDKTDRCRFVCMIQIRQKQISIEEGLKAINWKVNHEAH